MNFKIASSLLFLVSAVAGQAPPTSPNVDPSPQKVIDLIMKCYGGQEKLDKCVAERSGCKDGEIDCYCKNLNKAMTCTDADSTSQDPECAKDQLAPAKKQVKNAFNQVFCNGTAFNSDASVLVVPLTGLVGLPALSLLL